MRFKKGDLVEVDFSRKSPCKTTQENTYKQVHEKLGSPPWKVAEGRAFSVLLGSNQLRICNGHLKLAARNAAEKNQVYLKRRDS